MSIAFAPGSIGQWVNTPANLYRLPNFASAFNGTISDVFLPAWSTPDDFNRVRAFTRPNGAKMRAQMFAVPNKNIGETPEQFAARVDSKRDLLKPGCIELDIEVSDDKLSDYIERTIAWFRDPWMDGAGVLHQPRRPGFLLRVNIEPFKAYTFSASLKARFRNDPYLYCAEQTYYGDMSRVSEAEVLADLVGTGGVPWSKVGICYGMAGPVTQDGKTRGITLPDVMYQGHFSGRSLLQFSSMLFSDDLGAEVGFWG
jgi:hypothetical protein